LALGAKTSFLFRHVAYALLFTLLAAGSHMDVAYLQGVQRPVLLSTFLADHWLLPHISDQTCDSIVLFLRKCAHLTEYAVLALLFWRAMRKPVRRDPRPWSPRLAILSIIIVMLYAATDEIHQSFVPTRTAHFSDVVIDTTGGAAGIFALWLIGRWRKSW